MLRRHLSIPFIFAALVAGCNSDRVTSLTAYDPAADGQLPNPAGIPLIGDCVTTSTSAPVGPGKLRILVNGMCNFSYLGRTHFFADQIADFGGGTLSGTNVFTTVSGDQIYSVNSGPLAPPVNGVLTVGGNFTVTGGRGRFERTSGQGTFAGTVNVAAQTGANSWDGTLR